MLRALLLLSLGLSAQARELPVSVDLSAQFSPGERLQQNLNSCHAFAAVALMEAAVYRRTGETIRLSEADLWVRTRTLLEREGGAMLHDLRVGLRRGVTPGDWYPEMKGRYEEGMKSGDLLKRDLLPEARTPEAKKARRAVRDILRDAAASTKPHIPFSCVGREKRREHLMELLAGGVPVGVGVLLNRMEEPWKSKRGSFGGPHYFLLTGYERTENGVVFKTRNWWSEPKSDLHENDLCALFASTWLD
jgi:hypothetical protein